MEEKSELGDIILNKNTTPNNNKKVLLAVATLGIILIVVVLLMNTFSSSKEENLPQAVLPPKPAATVADATTQEQTTQEQEPLFEDVEVIDEGSAADEEQRLEAVAKKLKSQTQQEQKAPAVVKREPKEYVAPKTEPKKVHTRAVTHKKAPVAVSGRYYVQVGSFSKYEPNKKFLHSITARGYHYKYHKVDNLTKVLIGPYSSKSEARKALKDIKRHIEKGAFITKI